MIGRCVFIGLFLFIGIAALQRTFKTGICWSEIMIISTGTTLLYILFDIMDEHE